MVSDLPPCGQSATWPYIGRMKWPEARPRVVSRDASEPTTCTDVGGQGRDRTADLPLFRRRRSQKQDVCAGQVGGTGPILTVKSTQSKPRGGCGADENEPVIRRDMPTLRSDTDHRTAAATLYRHTAALAGRGR